MTENELLAEIGNVVKTYIEERNNARVVGSITFIHDHYHRFEFGNRRNRQGEFTVEDMGREWDDDDQW